MHITSVEFVIHQTSASAWTSKNPAKRRAVIIPGPHTSAGGTDILQTL